MKFKKTLLIFSLFFVSCDRDPISGLERGWIWGGKDEATITIQSVNSYTMLVKIYEGKTTDESDIIENFEMEPAEIREFDIKTKKDYTLYVKTYISYSSPRSRTINVKKSCTLKVGQYGIDGC
jgi:hypothetical protein